MKAEYMLKALGLKVIYAVTVVEELINKWIEVVLVTSSGAVGVSDIPEWPVPALVVPARHIR